ncbi:hypothetical protein MHM93_09725 [Pseudoalteromonas sp. MM17-2]|uniref:hypothetical protein n=1 Tax=Pseudoalteromonas sp. MM17-2 TaxID=2917753 RepID=UPI001EF3DD25|nr:hypothetical protein [Pseudoalteromonas sp. MM17-2]MCG7544460.1 hypothetical protein [Pseudoalteromonas sp. MM17-2]
MFNYNGTNGSYQLSLQEQIVTASFVGAINSRMLESFASQLQSIINDSALTHWGYISNSQRLSAATPDAQQKMIALAKHMRAHGCQASAFVIDSAIAISQLDKVRQSLHLEGNTRDIIFSCYDEALRYVKQQLNPLGLGS